MALVQDDLPQMSQIRIAQDSLIECEFSEIGRNPRFAPGWFIVPATMLTGLVAVALLGWML